jgi:hypothetical protein
VPCDRLPVAISCSERVARANPVSFDANIPARSISICWIRRQRASIHGDLGLIAIEAKYSARVRSEDLRHLKAFKADYPQATCNLVYAGHERLLIDDVLCLPAEEFLRGLVVG